MGEGAFLFVLEDDERARARGARILGYVAGTASAGSPDAFNAWPAAPDALVRVMRDAIAPRRSDPRRHRRRLRRRQRQRRSSTRPKRRRCAACSAIARCRSSPSKARSASRARPAAPASRRRCCSRTAASAPPTVGLAQRGPDTPAGARAESQPHRRPAGARPQRRQRRHRGRGRRRGARSRPTGPPGRSDDHQLVSSLAVSEPLHPAIRGGQSRRPGRARHRRLARHRPRHRAGAGAARGRGGVLLPRAAKRRRGSWRPSITAAGGRAVAIACDVAVEEQVQAMAAAASQELGALDILVNNAGVTADGFLMMMDRAKWDRVLRVNLDGAYFCIRATVRAMLMRGWGRIINITSPSAHSGLPGQANYAASKAGLIGLTRVAARELAPKQRAGERGVAGADRDRPARGDAGGRAREAARRGRAEAARARRPKSARWWRSWRRRRRVTSPAR